MKPKTHRVSAAGFSPWVSMNRATQGFGVGFGVVLSSGATLTYSVQHTFDDLQAGTKDWSASRTTTTATITRVNHGLSVGDNSIVQGAGAPFDGSYSVASVVDADTYTVTVANSGATSVGNGRAVLVTARLFTHEDVAAKTASADGNYAFPPSACRLNVSSYTNGFADITVIQGG